jgi:hypothetical protein
MSFLYRDRAGYCQQFSGAAALMLRMVGIPARIASGFTPGTLNPDTHEYVVRDLDAHSWIEVWFQGIGWVPFDPTPALAPASSQSRALAPPSSGHGKAPDPTPDKNRLAALLGVRRDASGTTGGRLTGGGGTPWGLIALAALAAALLASSVVVLARQRRAHRRRAPAPCGDPDVDQLVRLLGRLGLSIDPHTTLFALERRLRQLGGEEAAVYVRRLRERRFGSTGRPPPGRSERRRLRRVLADAVEAGPWTRLHLALPNGPLPHLPSTKLARLQRTR